MISALYLHSTSCPMETSRVQIEQVYLFPKYCTLGKVFFFLFITLTSSLMFLSVVDLQGLDLCLAGGNAFDCGRYYSIIA